jgi:1-aminocyclopropane-1-carboxylate deaminase
LFFPPVSAQFIPPPHQNPWRAELFVLRLDLLHPALGGNKWFKLHRWFEKPEIEQAEVLSSMGGPWSNHLIAFSAMCQMAGKKAELWVRGEEPAEKNQRLHYLEKQGCRIHYLSRSDYRLLRESRQHPTDSGIPFLPEGGFSEDAVLGVEEKMAPLTRGWSTVLCAAGTGTTAAGLIKGAKRGTHIAVFPALPAEEQIESNIKKLLQNRVPEGVSYKVEQAWPSLRFGKINSETEAFSSDFRTKFAIPLDPVYTTRMMMSLMTGPGRKYLDRKGRILFIHSGGLFMPPEHD